MRLRVFLTVLILGCMAVGAADWARLDRYRAANDSVAALPDSSRRAVFYGNSITDFWIDRRPEFFADNGYVDRGISGQTTYQFLTRFRQDVVNLHPRVVVLGGATNDVAENTHPFSPDLTMGNIASMVEIARANGIKVVLSSVLPASEIYWRKSITDVPQRIALLNGRIKAYADSIGVPYADYFTLLVGPDGKGLDPAYTDDGVHPNAAGYALMESVVQPLVQAAVKE